MILCYGSVIDSPKKFVKIEPQDIGQELRIGVTIQYNAGSIKIETQELR